jgi:hypothetical protein
MTASTISQPLNNAPLVAQAGYNSVAKATANFSGGDALIGVSASAWSANPGPIGMTVWLDDQPTGAQLGTYASSGSMHLALGHTWAWCRGVSPGQHTIMLEAGPTTVTDQNDFACVTIIEPNDGLAIRLAEDAPCPTGTAQPLITARAETGDGGLLISGSSSGWVTQSGATVRSSLSYDGGDVAPMEVLANHAAQRLAVVPTDFIQDNDPNTRGEHEFQVVGGGTTQTDQNDIAHLAVVEWVDYAQAPRYLSQIQNQPAAAQHGDGGTIASVPLPTKGGTLLAKVGVSCWTQTANVPLIVGIQVDGKSLGFARIFANPSGTHMATVTNDLVLTGVPAGNHTLGLIGEANTITDQNDRVSAIAFEFPS